MWTAEARARSQERIEKECMDCRKSYRICRSQAPRSRRCPECQRRRLKEMRLENMVRQQHGRMEPKRDPDYLRLVLDVSGSWGANTRLTRGELKALLVQGYLAEGEQWEYQGEVYEVRGGELTTLAAESAEKT